MIHVDLANETDVPVDEQRLCHAAQQIVAAAGISSGLISLAIVDDQTIHGINRRFLAHDEPTDVISFVLEQQADHLEGEIVASIDTATRVAAELNRATADELLLYIVHGALHLVGYDDLDEASRQQMRQQEQHWLDRLGSA